MGVPVNGRETRLAIISESAYNVIPGGPVGTLLYVKSDGVLGKTARVTDDTMAGNVRGQVKSVKSERDLRGSIAAALNPHSMLDLFKHAVGAATAYRPAFNPAGGAYTGVAAALTGVRVLRANALCPTGATGILAYTAAGTTLTWTPPGGAAGTPVNVSAGGKFTLTGGGANQQLYVEVTAGGLPGGNQTDNAINVFNAYEQVFTVGADLLAGFILERDRGTKIGGGSRYLRRTGCRVSQFQVSSAPTGIAEASFEIIGADFSENAAALDASLDDFGHVAFSNLDCTIYVDGVASTGKHTAWSMQWSNDLDEDGRTIGGQGVRGMLEAGMAMVSGSFTSLFDDVAFLTKARTETDIAVLARWLRGTGSGLVGNEAIGIELPFCTLAEETEPVTGPKGTRITYNYNVHKPSSGELDAYIYVRTPRATV
jgi:hypothetical protein